VERVYIQAFKRVWRHAVVVQGSRGTVLYKNPAVRLISAFLAAGYI